MPCVVLCSESCKEKITVTIQVVCCKVLRVLICVLSTVVCSYAMLPAEQMRQYHACHVACTPQEREALGVQHPSTLLRCFQEQHAHWEDSRHGQLQPRWLAVWLDTKRVGTHFCGEHKVMLGSGAGLTMSAFRTCMCWAYQPPAPW
jgi:hypothetical protein